MNARHVTSALALASLVAIAGCKDPAKDTSHAVTTNAVTTSTATPNSANATVSPSAQTATYPFDASTSKITWVGSKVTGKHEGGFGTFDGTVQVVDGAPDKSRVQVEIATASLTSDVEKLTNHLRSADFFDVEKYPKATFVSTEVKKGGENGASHTITGNLTLHGVTKSVTFPATLQVGNDQVTVNADFAINRKEFGLNYPGKVNDLIRDDVVVKLAIVAKPAKKG